jgi:hypothetical protein
MPKGGMGRGGVALGVRSQSRLEERTWRQGVGPLRWTEADRCAARGGLTSVVFPNVKTAGFRGAGLP